MATPLINGVQYSWASIKFNMLGRTITGITSVNYAQDREKMDNSGAGDQPDHRTYGPRKAKADITLYQYEVDAIIAAAKNQGIPDILDIPPFDLVVVYQATSTSPARTDIVRNCEFTTNGIDVKQGDMKSEQKMPLITSHIDMAV